MRGIHFPLGQRENGTHEKKNNLNCSIITIFSPTFSLWAFIFPFRHTILKQFQRLELEKKAGSRPLLSNKLLNLRVNILKLILFGVAPVPCNTANFFKFRQCSIIPQKETNGTERGKINDGMIRDGKGWRGEMNWNQNIFPCKSFIKFYALGQYRPSDPYEITAKQ